MSTPTSCAGAVLLGGQVAGVLVCGYEESGHGWVPSWGSPGVSGWTVAVAGLSYGSAPAVSRWMTNPWTHPRAQKATSHHCLPGG